MRKNRSILQKYNRECFLQTFGVFLFFILATFLFSTPLFADAISTDDIRTQLNLTDLSNQQLD